MDMFLWSLLLVLALVAALLCFDVGRAWLRSELELMRADAWRRTATGPEPCTRADPRVALMVARQAALAAKMRAEETETRPWTREPTVLRRKP